MAINLISAVEELHRLTSQELSKLLRESENFVLRYVTSNGSLIQIGMERLASSLPLHLIAVLSSSGENDNIFSYFGEVGLPFTYFLRGLRLLHSLADLSTRHTRFEQIIMEDFRVSEQILDLVFYSLLVLAHYKQEIGSKVSLALLHSGLVACSLYLLNCCISSNWQDLVLVLLAHPKVDVFMDVAFDAVHIDIKFLCNILSTLNTDVLNEKLSISAAEKTAICVCQHCEASLQFVLSLCQQKLFRDRVLMNKELCRNGGILSLAQTILDLDIQQCFEENMDITAGVSRLKSNVLSILLQLCEAENISYLDEVAGLPRTMNLAQSVVLKILDLLKDALVKETEKPLDSLDRRTPKGLVLLNSLHLADIFSDDSNFRSFFMANITTVLAELLGMPHERFLSNWCSNNTPVVEEDAVLHYDPCMASGTVLDNLSVGPEAASLMSTQKDIIVVSPGTFTRTTPVSYAQQRTSYLVKVIANLHCFVPNICEEQEKDLFLNKFIDFLGIDKVKNPSITSASDIQKALSICTNLCSLTTYARCLIPDFLIEEDVGLLNLFYSQVSELISSHHSVKNILQDATSHEPSCNADSDININGVSQTTAVYTKEHLFNVDEKHRDETGRIENLAHKNEEHTENHMGFVHTKTSVNTNTSELLQAMNHPKEADVSRVGLEPEAATGEEKQPRKRKRNIMNDKQITLIENALLDEPEMHRNAMLLQSWAERLSFHGSELTPSQLKNWLNNRKARLARAAREVRAPSEGENTYDNKSVASNISQYYDSPESAGEDSYTPTTYRG